MAAVTATLPNKDANRATALKKYAGEVIASFRQKNIGLNFVKVRDLEGGTSTQFIVTGAAAEGDIQTHVRGEEVINRVLTNDEVTITVNTRYVHSHFLDDLDDKLAQYGVSAELAFQSGEVLATKVDKDIFYGITHDAGTMAALPGQSVASVVTATGYTAATTAEAKGDFILEAMFEGRSALDAKNVTMDATFVVAPADYYNLVQSKGINKDIVEGSNGGLDSGRIAKIAGIPVTWTNHLNKTDQSLGTGINALKLIGLMFTKDVFGVAITMNIQSEANYDFRRLGYQLTSYYAMGMAPLNPTGLVIVNAD